MMVETSRNISIFGEELHDSRMYRTLGLLNGLLVGLSLALGAWGIAAFTQASLPTRMPFTSFVLAAVLTMILTGTAGWLTARFAKAWFTLILWLLAAGMVVLLIGVEATHIRTLLTWLIDSRFWGLPVYPLPPGSILPILIAGFTVFLTLIVMAVLQDYRLEGIFNRLGDNQRWSLGAVFSLLLPLPFVVLSSFITNSIVSGANAPFAIQLVHEVIQTGRTYEGDLFQLSREEGINYNAIRGVRELMSENYTLSLSGFDPASSTVLVTAEFDNGAWIECRVVNEQLGFCSDASIPYTAGFSTLITGQPLPENCGGCVIRVDDTWRSWLMARRDNFESDPQIEKVVRQGTFTLMRAESPAGDYAVECWFQREGVIELQSCTETTAE